MTTTMNSQVKYDERLLTEAELPLVYDSWIKTFKSSPWAGCLPNHIATAVIRSCIVDLINAGAVLRGLFDGDRCVAWVCEDMVDDMPVVHFLYVKSIVPEGRMHEVREALAPTEGVYTYKTSWINAFLGPGFVHRPKYARNRSLKRPSGD